MITKFKIFEVIIVILLISYFIAIVFSILSFNAKNKDNFYKLAKKSWIVVSTTTLILIIVSIIMFIFEYTT